MCVWFAGFFQFFHLGWGTYASHGSPKLEPREGPTAVRHGLQEDSRGGEAQCL